jgi:hypothetical protein
MTDIDQDAVACTILRLAADRGGGTICPTEAARAASGDSDWHHLLPAVRRAAVRLALEGRIVITRKGKPVDPTDFKGVYRLGLPRND